ncbi:hypothetical protein [Calothrix sp. NIES-2100]
MAEFPEHLLDAKELFAVLIVKSLNLGFYLQVTADERSPNR